MLSVFGALLMAANFDRLLSASGLEAMYTPGVRKLQAENDQLRTLQTTTVLEEDLAKALMERNAMIEHGFQSLATGGVLLVLGLFLSGLLVEGVKLIMQTIWMRRYARVIDTIERNSRLYATGKTGSMSS